MSASDVRLELFGDSPAPEMISANSSTDSISSANPMATPSGSISSMRGTGMTQLIRAKLRFTDESLWKRFSARRLELIDTLALSERKASEQDASIRKVAHTLLKEYGYDESNMGDFERLVRAGIQSVRRNRKRLPKSKVPSPQTFLHYHPRHKLPLYPQQKFPRKHAGDVLIAPNLGGSRKRGIHDGAVSINTKPNITALRGHRPQFQRQESVTVKQTPLPIMSKPHGEMVLDSLRGRMSISSLVSPESLQPVAISQQKQSSPKSTAPHKIIPGPASLTVPLVLTPSLSAPLALRTITKFVSLLDTYCSADIAESSYSNVSAFASLGASALETAAFYAVSRNSRTIEYPLRTVHGLLLDQQVLAQVAAVLPSIVNSEDEDIPEYKIKQDDEYNMDQDGDIDFADETVQGDSHMDSQSTIRRTLTSLLTKIALCVEDRGFDSVIFMFCEIFEQILAVTCDPLPDVYESPTDSQLAEDMVNMETKTDVSKSDNARKETTPFSEKSIKLGEKSLSEASQFKSVNKSKNGQNDEYNQISPTSRALSSNNLFTLTAAAASISQPERLPKKSKTKYGPQHGTDEEDEDSDYSLSSPSSSTQSEEDRLRRRGPESTKRGIIPVSLKFSSQVLYFTYNPDKSTPPTVSEIVDNCQFAFHINGAERVLRIRDMSNDQFVETDGQLEDIYSNRTRIDLELVFSPSVRSKDDAFSDGEEMNDDETRNEK